LDSDTTIGTNTITFQSGLSGTITLTSGHLEVLEPTTITGPSTSTITVSGNNSSGVFSISATATISGLIISNGRASARAGIFNSSTLTLQNSTVSGNAGSGIINFGGGIYNSGTLTLENTTISGNTAAAGGGLANFGTATLRNCTIIGSGGDGIDNFASCSLTNTIVANSSGSDLQGTFSGTNDLIGDGSGSGLTSPLTGNPQLASLQDNGGTVTTL